MNKAIMKEEQMIEVYLEELANLWYSLMIIEEFAKERELGDHVLNIFPKTFDSIIKNLNNSTC
jgi:hypothetical protein